MPENYESIHQRASDAAFRMREFQWEGAEGGALELFIHILYQSFPK
jgi:hypothetical protein